MLSSKFRILIRQRVYVPVRASVKREGVTGRRKVCPPYNWRKTTVRSNGAECWFSKLTKEAWKVGGHGGLPANLLTTYEMAVEVAPNNQRFPVAMASHVARVVAVSASQFKVITHSVRKTDPVMPGIWLFILLDLMPKV